MARYIIKRCLQALPVLFGVSTLVFFLIHFIPGDPVDMMLGENALPANKEALREQLGLHLPLLSQYGEFLKGILQGDFGVSIYSKRSVFEVIFERAPATILLMLLSMSFAISFALPLGITAALKKGTWVDQLAMLVSLVGISIPTFWMGPLLILLFSIELGWFPVSERSGFSSYILPSFTLGLAMAAMIARMSRSSMLEVLKQDFVVTARAKGLLERTVILKHALKNALVPVITILGLQVGSLLSGSIITETIFDWPGIGSLIYQAIQTRDYPMVQGCVLVIATSYVVVNLLTDIAYAVANPRIRLE